METQIFKTALLFHVLCGFLSLASGLVAMRADKGSKVHNTAGLVFYWAMLGVFLTTILFFVIYPQEIKYQFFLTIGIVSFYPNWSGKRMLSMKKGLEPKWFDILGGFLIGISGIVMLAYAVYSFVNPALQNQFAILFLVFGLVSLANCYGDLRYYLKYKEAPKMHWFFAHGGKMMGAYSAALTAFCVNIVPRMLPSNTPNFVHLFFWIAPGVILGVLSAKILKKYRIKFKIAA
jgi:uncharacterized membrane protein